LYASVAYLATYKKRHKACPVEQHLFDPLLSEDEPSQLNGGRVTQGNSQAYEIAHACSAYTCLKAYTDTWVACGLRHRYGKVY